MPLHSPPGSAVVNRLFELNKNTFYRTRERVGLSFYSTAQNAAAIYVSVPASGWTFILLRSTEEVQDFSEKKNSDHPSNLGRRVDTEYRSTATLYEGKLPLPPAEQC